MNLTTEELKKIITDYNRVKTIIKNICAEFMGGCPAGCVEDMEFDVIDDSILIIWEEDTGWTYKHHERTIPVDWLSKSHDEVLQAIWDILRKEREKEERKKEREERAKQKAKEDEERKVYEELKKKFERKKK